MEIKIDYCEAYEKIRIKNGYPRVEGATLAKLQEEIRNEDADFVEQCEHASLAVVDKNLAFLETFAEEQTVRGIAPADEARQRALFVAILSLTRMDALSGGADQDGDVAAVKGRAVTVFRRLVDKSLHADKTDLLAGNLFRPALQKYLCVNAINLFLDRLQELYDGSD